MPGQPCAGRGRRGPGAPRGPRKRLSRRRRRRRLLPSARRGWRLRRAERGPGSPPGGDRCPPRSARGRAGAAAAAAGVPPVRCCAPRPGGSGPLPAGSMAGAGLYVGDQLIVEEDYDDLYIPSEQGTRCPSPGGGEGPLQAGSAQPAGTGRARAGRERQTGPRRSQGGSTRVRVAEGRALRQPVLAVLAAAAARGRNSPAVLQAPLLLS